MEEPQPELVMDSVVAAPAPLETPDIPQLEKLSIQEESDKTSPLPSPDLHHEGRSESPRRSTDLTPDDFVQALRAEVNKQQRPRSPYSRTHLRSYSGQPPLSAPPMNRTRSLPVYESRRLPSPSHSPVRPSSPLRPPPSSSRSSPRRSFEDMRPTSLTPSFMEDIEENSELDITPRPAPALDHTLHAFPHANTLPRSNSGRRRPHSPLHSLSSSIYQPPPPSPRSYPLTTLLTPTGLTHSPSSTPPPANPARFNEAYPMGTTHHTSLPSSSSISTLSTMYSSSYSASSMPSTPTSFRSRSPSISSLETIPDTPDAEAEAQATAADEAVELKKLREAAEQEEAEEEKRGVLRRKPNFTVGATEVGKRKRWSVCGGERRDAFEMETIWED